jgi:hypothetical protein
MPERRFFCMEKGHTSNDTFGCFNQADAEFGPIELSWERIMRYLAYGDGNPSKPIRRQIEGLIPRAVALAGPKAIAELIPIDGFREKLPALLAQAEEIVASVCTIGPALEQEAQKLQDQGRQLEGFLLDALGSAAISEVTEKIGRRVFDWGREQGISVTRAFEPGAGASPWPITGQELIFSLLSPERIDVRLNSTLLMLPKKSISFAMGVGGQIPQAAAPFSCEGCPRTGCPYRYEPEGPHR